MNLFCLPYAGATASIYKKWEQELGGAIRIQPLELPGRGRKFGQSLLSSMERLIQHAFEDIRERIGQADYALFGHSLGAAMAFRLAEKLEQSDLPNPHHIFVSGVLPPHEPKPYRIDPHLADPQLIEQLRLLGGLPEEVGNRPDLMKIMLPIIRADLHAHNDDPPRQLPGRHVQCGMTVLYGKEDPLTSGDMRGWTAYTAGECRFEAFDGGHFFIHDLQSQVTSLLVSTLQELD